MGKTKTIFGEQITERKRRDKRGMEQSLIDVADIVFGREPRFYAGGFSAENVRHEIEQICGFFRVKAPDSIPDTQDTNEIINYMTRAVSIMHRRVRLGETWWKDGDGPLLAVRKSDGRIFALLPAVRHHYSFINDDGKKVYITGENQKLFDRNAVCFYEPLPYRSMTGWDLIVYLVRGISSGDMCNLLVTTILVMNVGLIMPFATRVIFSSIIPTGSVMLVSSIAVLLLATAAASYLLSTLRTGLLDRIRQRMEVRLDNAVMGRLINLPPKFFQGKSSGSLSQSMITLQRLPAIVVDGILDPGLNAVFSVVYAVQIAVMTPDLAAPAFISMAAIALVLFVCMRQKMKLIQRELEGEMKTQGIVYPLITGIQRIRLSGSEDRAVARWARIYKERAGAAYLIRFPSAFQKELVAAVTLLCTLWVYYIGRKSGIEISQFAAFLASFGLMTTNLLIFSQKGQMLAHLSPILEMAGPILQELPEVSIGKRYIKNLRGSIDINHVSFRYADDQPYIFTDLDLHIRPGEYVAIVGKSGCGKSTVLRLLMGFERPELGTVSYDDIDIEEIDPTSLHRNMGTVLQDGKLFGGDIFSNITISAPHLTMKEAWEAAERAGIADAIRQMPMGMHTLISEGSGGISGGQKQRLLIARAIAPKPQILIFDEATSALDNITQKIVSNSLEELHCTRIVVAHRLSTIRNCDRIIVLDQGRILEDGSYDELIAKNGFFAELVARQQVEET